MENLPTFKFRDRSPGEDLGEYVDALKSYTDESLNQVRLRTNWLLERVHVVTETNGVSDRNGTRFTVFELVPPKKTKNTDGNFRLRMVPHGSSFDLQIEVRVDGVWLDVKKYHG